jgi:hypothetical protein
LLVSDHSFVGSKAGWEVIGADGAPQFEEDGPPLARDQRAEHGCHERRRLADVPSRSWHREACAL